MARMRQAKRSKRQNTLVCPHCKAGDLRYIEDEIIVRKIEGFREDGTLMIAGHFDCEGDGLNPRLLCVECMAVSSIPKGLEYGFD